MPGVNMKLLSLLPLAAALATTTAISQEASHAALPLWTASLDRCPIGLEVKRGGLFAERRLAGGVPFEGAVQRVEVDVSNPGSRKIVEVGMTVHGYSNKQRAFTLGGPTPDLARNVNLTLDVEGKGHASSHLALRDFTALAWFEVNTLRYADGSVWKATESVCRVAPNAMMRISLSR